MHRPELVGAVLEEKGQRDGLVALHAFAAGPARRLEDAHVRLHLESRHLLDLHRESADAAPAAASSAMATRWLCMFVSVSEFLVAWITPVLHVLARREHWRLASSKTLAIRQPRRF